jgi:hypothetical protein
MDPMRRIRSSLLARLLLAAGLAATAIPSTACGKFVVDDGSNGAGGAGGASTSDTGAGVGGSSHCGLGTTGVTTGGQNMVQLTECFSSEGAACPSPYEATAHIIPSASCAYLKSVDCGPVIRGDACCYDVTEEQNACGGRPLRADGIAIVARPGEAAGWSKGTTPTLNDLSPDERAGLGAAWAHDAHVEHASIASFSRFALELMALGAPGELVEEAHRAALDEVRHARLCFALAEGYTGRRAAPGTMPLGPTLALASSLEELAVSTAREACIGETISAIVAAEQLTHATDPAVRRALAAIATDEARHAELAWRTISWAIREGGESVRRAVADVFATAAAHLPMAWSLEGARPQVLAAHGRLDRATTDRAVARALHDVVLPAAHALLNPSSARAA